MPDEFGHHTDKELDECEDWEDIFDDDTPTPHDVHHALGGCVDEILAEAAEDMGDGIEDSNPYRSRPLAHKQDAHNVPTANTGIQSG